MSDDLTNRELQALALVAAFPVAYPADPEVGRLIALGFLARSSEGTLVVTPAGRGIIRRWLE